MTALVGSAAFAGSALASPAGDLATATNTARVSAGLPALTENAQLDAVAQAWANKLAAAGVLSHNPAVRTQVTNWTVLGENVGMAGDVPTVQNAFMHSPEHKANILDPRYTQMGVGSATSIYPSCGCPVLWVVVDFRRPVTVTTAPVAPKAPAPVKTIAKPATVKPAAVKPAAVKAAPKVTTVTQHVATTATVTATAPAAAAPTVVPSATALRSQLAASASPASTGDPVSRMLNFATVLSQLPN
ncbi:MAG TPA: CAP domain-containing protein [Acidothermaceae bacterium]|nr:CAP domain-containing protein [Acidothermaceae bacterium]